MPLNPPKGLYHQHLLKKIMEEFLFNKLFALLYDHGASEKKREGAWRHWQTLTSDEQTSVLTTISKKLEEGKFVQFDPIRAIKENTPRKPKRQILSMSAYYELFGTTEERDGWHQENPTGSKVIYVKYP